MDKTQQSFKKKGFYIAIYTNIKLGGINMVKRIGTFRRKTRHKLRKDKGTKGKISLSEYFKEFKTGDKVILKAEPSIQKLPPD